MVHELERYRVAVDDDVLTDLRDRLARTRLPVDLPGSGWEYGIPVDVVRDLVEYWRTAYDWRTHEARLNTFDHFRTLIDGQTIHFVHARSPHEHALPLLLVHGWPGSILEFLDVIPMLTEPEQFGADPAIAFHVVVPSLPGYGFSGPTTQRGWDVARTAHAFIELMHRLGYEQYGAQGGDWGAQITTRIAALDADHCVGLHLNMPSGTKPEPHVELTEHERADLAELRRFQAEEFAYATLQGTKPHTLAVGCNDSPAGLLAWIAEKFRAWSDCDGNLERAFTRDQIITNVMIYWVTQTIGSSFRMYWETFKSADVPTYVEVPTGVARYPKEILRLPRAWVERCYNVTYWNELPGGGHFAAMEQPTLFANDVRAFFATVR